MKYLIFSLLLWSRVAVGQVESCFATVDSIAFPLREAESSLKNLPRVRSQGGFNACFGYAGATIAQYYHCNFGKVVIKDCASAPLEKTISPWEMIAQANRTSESRHDYDIGNHDNIKFGGATISALGVSAEFGTMLPESCYPIDPLVNKYGNDAEAVRRMLEKVQKIYTENRGKTEAEICLECMRETVLNDLNVKANLSDIKLALSKGTFAEFLYYVTLGTEEIANCKDEIEFKPRPKMNYFPEKGKTANPDETVGKIREVLKSGYPLALDGICPYTVNGKCTGLHSVVITGYREQCTKDKSKCRKLVRVQNSWGEEWQQKNDDGWVDAMTLLGGQNIEEGGLSWWTKKTP